MAPRQTVSSALATQPEPAPVPRSRNATHQQSPVRWAPAPPLAGATRFGAVEPGPSLPWKPAPCFLLRSGPHASGSTANSSSPTPALPSYGRVPFHWWCCNGVMEPPAYRQVTYSHLLLYARYGMLVLCGHSDAARSPQFELLANCSPVRRAGGLFCHAAGSGATENSTGSGP